MNKRKIEKHKAINNNTITPRFYKWETRSKENYGGDETLKMSALNYKDYKGMHMHLGTLSRDYNSK